MMKSKLYFERKTTTETIDFFKLGKSMLRIWGLWPIENLSPLRSTIYKMYGFSVIMVTLLPYNVFSALDTLFQIKEGRWMDIMPRLSVALAMLLGTLKVVVCVYNTSTIQRLMQTYETDDSQYERTPFFNPDVILRRCKRLYNMQTAVCFGLVGILIMTDIETLLKPTTLRPDNSTVRPLPFINWLPYDFSYSPYYEISFVLTNFWFFVCAYVIFVYDTICMGQMIYTVGELQILKLALCTLRSRASYHLKGNNNIINYNGLSGDPPDELIDNFAGKMFKKCARHHQTIIQFTQDFQKLYSIIIFLQFFISCLMICFTILVVTNGESHMSSRVTCLIILVCSMWELSVYCFFGNEIIHESNQLSVGIFSSEWYSFSQPTKKNLSIVLTRTQKPIVITVGRFVPLSLETFLTILKASYSYYAFLRKVS